MAQVEVGKTYYWHTAEHWKYNSDIEVERLFRWLEQYESLKGSFAERNKLAFRFANMEWVPWWDRLTLVAAEPELWDRHREALVHLASASYTRLTGPKSFTECLVDREPRVVQGALILLPELRPLRMDGGDSSWPADQLLDPLILPERAARVLKKHPTLGVWVARALAAYGPAAVRQTGTLVPLLLAEDEQTASAAKSAIRMLDPKGIAKKFNLREEGVVSQEQKQQVTDSLSKQPERETEFQIHPKYAKQFADLLRHLAARDSSENPRKTDPEADQRFLESAAPEDWWPVLIAASLEGEFGNYQSDFLVSQVAGALYLKKGSPAVVAQLLKSDDPRIAGGIIDLLSSTKLYRNHGEHYFDGDHVDPERMPQQFGSVLQRHPELCLYVAVGLETYRLKSGNQSDAIIPYLLSDDPSVVWGIRRALTTINPTLANSLECELSVEDHDGYVMEVVEATVLTERQRTLVQKYLDTKK